MPNNGYFDTPFAAAGPVATVPDAIQMDGSVSYTGGYSINYTQDPAINPTTALNIEETKFNQLLNDITTAIQLIQQNGCSNFITTSMNGGSPYSYNQGATVLSGGIVYFSLVANNTTVPPSSSWTPLSLSSIVFVGTDTAGGVNAQTTTAANFVLAKGVTVFAKFGLTNTNATQLNVSGGGLVNVYKQSPSGPIPLIGGECVVNNMGQFTYDGTEWQLMNPAPVSSSSAIQSLISVQAFTASGTWTKPAGCNAVEVEVQAGAGGPGITGSKSSFGSQVISDGTGASTIYAIGAGAPVAASGGDSQFGTGGGTGGANTGYGSGTFPLGGGQNTGYFGGEYAYGYMAASILGTTVTVTVGSATQGGMTYGSDGIVVVKAYR